MLRARTTFLIIVSCVVVILCCVILQDPFNLSRIRERKHDLPHSSVILSEEEKLYEISNPALGLAAAINRERAELADLVQGRIKALQNPDDCTMAKKLVCTVNHGPSWDQMFLPLSSTCLDGSGASFGNWGGGGENISAQVVAVGTYSMMASPPDSPWEPLRPTRIPSQFESRLRKITKDPLIWWVGQFAAYVMRLSPETEKIIKEAKENIIYEDSIATNLIQIGIHVRRTDKLIAEAKSYPLETYLGHVEQHLKRRVQIEGNPISGHIFLASDEPDVIKEARALEKKTNKWKLWANEAIAKDAKDVTNRYQNGMLGILTDVMLLVNCEFVVCTFSSNVCRLVAELKEAEGNVGGEVISIDNPYSFLSMHRVE